MTRTIYDRETVKIQNLYEKVHGLVNSHVFILTVSNHYFKKQKQNLPNNQTICPVREKRVL